MLATGAVNGFKTNNNEIRKQTKKTGQCSIILGEGEPPHVVRYGSWERSIKVLM